MSVFDSHAGSREDINNFDIVITLDHFSIAINEVEMKPKMISAFKHSHDEYEFIMPITTIPLLFYANANYIGEVGFCYPVNPYVEHGVEVDLHSKVISIAFEKNYFNKLKAELGFEGQYFYTRFLYKRNLLDLIKDLVDTYQNNKNNKAALESFAKRIASLLIKLGLESGADNRRPEKKYIKNMRNILMYIEKNYRDPNLTIAKLADLTGYSLAYFTKAFKLYMNDTPIMHLNKRRISEAKTLLRNEKLSLGEIAKGSGYKNLSTFTQAFERVMGMLPSEYRKKYL